MKDNKPQLLDVSKLPVDRAVSALIDRAVEAGASDLFFVTNEQHVAVQVRHLHVQEHHVGPFPVAGGVTAARATTNTPTSRARCPFTDMRTRRSRLGPIPTW